MTVGEIEPKRGTEPLCAQALAAVLDDDDELLRRTLAGMTRRELSQLWHAARTLDDRAFRAWSQRAPVAWGS